MELNIEAVLIEAGSVSTNFTHRCLILAGQVRGLQDLVKSKDVEIEELKKQISELQPKETK